MKESLSVVLTGVVLLAGALLGFLAVTEARNSFVPTAKADPLVCIWAIMKATSPDSSYRSVNAFAGRVYNFDTIALPECMALTPETVKVIEHALVSGYQAGFSDGRLRQDR